MKNALLLLLLIPATTAVGQSQQSSPNAPQPGDNSSDVSYHLVTFMPQYRCLSTTGNTSRVGQYDSLQQSVGGDLSLNQIYFPQHMTFKFSTSFVSQDDYDLKSRLIVGKWLDLGLDSRSFIRHLDDVNYFAAAVISPDIFRTDTIPADSLLGVRRRTNSAYAKVKLPQLPVKLFVKGGWLARDGISQMQYYDMGGSGQRNDTQCDNCHSSSQYRTLNYTTRNIAGGAEISLGPARLTYQHEFRSFNDRRQNPLDFYGTAGDIPPIENIPYTFAGLYVHSVLPRHETQSDSLQLSLTVAHHAAFNGDVSYARTTNLFTHHPQNAFNADTTLTWTPVSRLRAVVDFHQQNLLNDFLQTYSLSNPTLIYPFGNPSLHRQWGGVKLAYRLSQQFDTETYYKRVNITRSDASLWPQFASPGNNDPLMVIPATSSNVLGAALRFHTKEFWNVRAGYEWTGTHDPGYVTDPVTNHRIFGDLTLSPTKWFIFTNDASIVLQRSFPAIQRSNSLYTETAFVTFRPIPKWSVGGGYTYLQDNLRTDMRFANDSGVGLFNQSLVPYKQLSQTYSVRSNYELKQRLGLNLDFAHSVAHSGFRPDLNPATYPIFPGAVSVAGYASDQAFAQAFANALTLSSGLVSQVNVPQTIVGATGDYHFHSGFDGGLRFNYGSYTDSIRPDLNGKLRSYSVFFGRTW